MAPIPTDLLEFLTSSKNRILSLADGEIRQLEFFAPVELKLSSFIVNSYELYLKGILKTDPDEERQFEGCSLIRECNSYSAEGVLVWFPEFNSYGSADPDHQSIIIYPTITWSDIIRDPTWYVNGQWHPDRVTHEEVNPWRN